MIIPRPSGRTAPPATAADFTSTWNSTSGNWTDTTKWSTPGAPGTFPNNGVSTYDAIQSGGFLTMNQSITLQKYNLTGGDNYTPSFTLTLNDLLTWTGGTFNGGGAVNANGGATLSGGTKSVQDTRVVNLDGTSTWSAGNFEFYQSSSLVNKVGGTLTTTFGGNMNALSGGLGFTNAGTFTKNTSSATTTINIPFNNTGIVNVDTGALTATNGGASTGAWNVAAGATLNFSGGTRSLNAGTNVSAAGTVVFSGGTTNFNAGTYSVTGTTQINGGTANFNSAASTGSLTYSSGALNVSSTLSLGNGSSVLASTWSGGPLTLNNGGTLTNTVGSTLTTNFAGTLAATGTGTKTFNNAGTFTKSGTASTTTINSVLNNTGTVNANIGTLTLAGGVIQHSGTTLNGGTWNVAAGTIDGPLTATSGNATTIAPGASPGTLTINGSTVLGVNNTLTMEVGGLAAGIDYDVLDVNGILTLGGLLDIDFINGFQNSVQFYDFFTIATADSPILGSFSNVLSGTSVGTNTALYFNVWYGAGSPFGANNLVITQAPEPSRALLLLVGLVGVLMRRRRM